MTNEEYKAAVGAIPHPPFSSEWEAEVAPLSAALTATFNAEKDSVVRVETNAEGEEVILASAQERICRDCGTQFTIPKRRGRPPVCCPKCLEVRKCTPKSTTTFPAATETELRRPGQVE